MKPLHKYLSCSRKIMGLGKWSVCLRILILITLVIVVPSLLRIGWKTHRYPYPYNSNTKLWTINKSVSRTEELKKLQDLVQRRLWYLQNPKNCSSAKKVLCRFANAGYGSQMNDWIFCLIVAYATQRTLIIESGGWRYARGGLQTTFLPISTTCTTIYNEKAILSYDLRNISGIQVVQLPRNSQVKRDNRPSYLPWSIPDDLADDLVRLHDFPPGWWIGQFLLYLTRPQPEVKQFIESTIQTLGFRHPIVGIHVRRTDKYKEAPYQELKEYMKYVEEWFDKNEMTQGVVRRNVFLATDDPNIITQAKQNYASYTFVTNINASKMAQQKETRFSESSLRGLLLDIEMLSMCDYVVCTFSSNIGNIVYELMQVRYWDAPTRIKSLDIDFGFFRHIKKKWRNNRRAKNIHNFTGITNATEEKQISAVIFDFSQKRVKMPTYPEVPRL